MSLKEAVSVALDSNPQIGQAIQNREAIEFELRQARGLYFPRVDVEASAGLRRYDRESLSAAGTFNGTPGRDNRFAPREIGAVLTQKLFDGWATDAEVERQASRVDGASFRVLERSENVALAIAREYIQVILQARVIVIAQENLAFHRQTLSDIDAGVKNGSLTDADRQQATERLAAAEVKYKQAEEDYNAAKIRFYTLVGLPLAKPGALPVLRGYLPPTLDEAIGVARKNNPTVKLAAADVDAAHALVKAARAKYLPEVIAEGRARTGHDIDLNEGNTKDYQGRIIAKWTGLDGGIRYANEQEQIRRASEARLRLHQAHREVEEQVRLAWDRRKWQGTIGTTLAQQYSVSISVVSSYRDQFKIGRRSLLDVLDSQNTRFNTAVLVETAKYAAVFADYQLLASTGNLVHSLGLTPPRQAEADARAGAKVPLQPPAEILPRSSPGRF